MLPSNDPDRIQITFDDHRLVANAGLILPTRPPAKSHRHDTRRCLDAHPLLDGRHRRRGGDHIHALPQ